MPAFLTFITIGLILGLKTCAQQTIIPSIDARVQYSERDWLRPGICEYIGNDVPDPNADPGCYNLGPSPCADNFTLSLQPEASATLVFRGTAVSVETLTQLAGSSSHLSFSLDGDAADIQVDETRGHLECPEPIFSRAGLDEDSEHTLVVTLRAGAPNGGSDAHPFLALKQFVITGGATTSPGTTSPPNQTGPSTPTATGFTTTPSQSYTSEVGIIGTITPTSTIPLPGDGGVAPRPLSALFAASVFIVALIMAL